MHNQLEKVKNPGDLSRLTSLELNELAKEIRSFLVQEVSKTGGHLGPNLGVVELTIALHRVFHSPVDTIVFDTGHQSYVHKLLTGRKDFSNLRSAAGLTGYPSRAESEHDVVENSHASTALSWAQGIAEEKYRQGNKSWTVAVIGDGALTGGLAWEALNNIADRRHLRLVIVVNDNGRSYAPTIGGLAHHLDALRTSPAYERALKWSKKQLKSRGRPGNLAYDALHGLKAGVQDILSPQGVFTHLGIKYTGPVDGHDIAALEFAFTRAMDYRGPVIVHAITQKGRGYQPAENHEGDRFHAIGPIHPETGLPIIPERFEWTSIFADEMVNLGRKNSRLVAITAAMLQPVGLKPFREAFPGRVYDVGIAEQHAMTLAAGLSFAGAHPVVALYATFMNRGYDQLLMDIALHKAPVTICLDRAGLTGNDGASHNGMWDLALSANIPGLRVAVPRDASSLRRLLSEAVNDNENPTLLRYPKGEVPNDFEVLETVDGSYQVMARAFGTERAKRVRIIALGALAATGIKLTQEISERYGSQVEMVECIDPGWAFPIAPRLLDEAKQFDLLITLEDGLAQGGFGSLLRDQLSQRNCFLPVRSFGIKAEFQPTDTRNHLLETNHLTVETILTDLDELFTAEPS